MGNNQKCNSKIILTSFGMTCEAGRELLREELKDINLDEKKIFIYYKPYFNEKENLQHASLKLEFKEENVKLIDNSSDINEIQEGDYIYIGEGDQLEIMKLLRTDDMIIPIRDAFEKGATYIGASAGAIVAGENIKETFAGKRYFWEEEVKGLKLFDGIVIPHCEKDSLESYINYKKIGDTYNKIYSVSNEECLVLNSDGEVLRRWEGVTKCI